jgi:hypothetical protein
MPYRFRFSLGQLMGVIAVSALLTANAIFISRGNLAFYSLIAAGLSSAGLGVLFFNRRLSGWIWVWIAGQSGPLLLWGFQAPTVCRASGTGLLRVRLDQRPWFCAERASRE